MNNIISRKALLVAAVAMAACIAGSASADEPPTGPNPRHTPVPSQPPAPTTTPLKGYNGTAGCVRFFVNGQHDAKPGATIPLGTATLNKSYMASTFKGACGGAALKNVWLTPTTAKPNTTLTWLVR